MIVVSDQVSSRSLDEIGGGGGVGEWARWGREVACKAGVPGMACRSGSLVEKSSAACIDSVQTRVCANSFQGNLASKQIGNRLGESLLWLCEESSGVSQSLHVSWLPC